MKEPTNNKDLSIYKYTPKNRPNAAFRVAESQRIVTYGHKHTSLLDLFKSFFLRTNHTMRSNRWLEVGE